MVSGMTDEVHALDQAREAIADLFTSNLVASDLAWFGGLGDLLAAKRIRPLAARRRCQPSALRLRFFPRRSAR